MPDFVARPSLDKDIETPTLLSQARSPRQTRRVPGRLSVADRGA